MEEILCISSLSFSYGQTKLLENVNARIEKGDFAALIGPNGAGKSTLLRLILGELSPSSGSISLFGQSVKKFRDWPRIGFLPQDAMSLCGSFPASVREIVASNLYSCSSLLTPPSKRWQIHKQGRIDVDEALDRTGMLPHAKRLVGELSGGQQQRVLLARVLVGKPDLMILDEPTVGIDAASLESLYTLLKQLRSESGLTTLMVTHDTAKLTELADRIFCLDFGSIIELSPKEWAHEQEGKHQHPHCHSDMISN